MSNFADKPSSLTELNVLEIRYKSLKRIAAMLENLHKSRVQASSRFHMPE